MRYDPITTIDLASTFADYAGVEGGMPGSDGISMRPTIDEGRPGLDHARGHRGHDGRHGRTSATSSSARFQSALNTEGIRTARWKFTKYSTGEIELYDLQNDPLELHSLQDDPAYDPDQGADGQALGALLRLQGRRVRRAAACASLRATPRRDEGDHRPARTARQAQYYDDPFPERWDAADRVLRRARR